MTKITVDFTEQEKGKMHWLSWMEQNPEKVQAIRDKNRKAWLKKQKRRKK